MTLLGRLLATFALGMIATGLVLGFLPAGSHGCGAAFSSGHAYTDVCSEPRALRRQMPVALIGLGITAGIGAGVVVNEKDKLRSSS